MNVLVCIKRVPAPGARIVLTEDGRTIDTRHLGFTMSPHEECAVEEAVRIVEQHGGTSTVLTLGPEAADEQLRHCLSVGVDRAVLLPSGDEEWDPVATGSAIAGAVGVLEAEAGAFDLLLFGNESADAGGYQVPVRVAHALGLPCLGGVKSLALDGGMARAERGTAAGRELYDIELPAVVAVKEGINLPRYPALRGRLKAKGQEIARIEPSPVAGGPRLLRLLHPAEQESTTRVLGEGPAAAPQVVAVLDELGLI